MSEDKPAAYWPVESIFWEKLDKVTRVTMFMWYTRGIYPGSCIDALLCNNLVGFVNRADDAHLKSIKSLARFVWDELPHACWGSVHKVWGWADARREDPLEPESMTWDEFLLKLIPSEERPR